ncbi:MAG: CHAT domain-containing protein, partial [Gemmatimonadaceae bacterium]
MALLAGALLGAAALPASPGRGDDPRAVVLHAYRAVEGDSAKRVAARWAERVRRDPRDRVAQLGLATVARLTYDFAAAERWYAGLLAAEPNASAPRPDRIGIYARLGQAQVFEARRQLPQADSLYARAAADARVVGDSAAASYALLNTFALRVSTVGLTKAQPVLDSAARLIPPGALDLAAQYHCARAAALVPAGQLDTAMAEISAGITAADRANVPATRARCMSNAGRVARARGQLDTAAATLRQAAALQERLHDFHGLDRTLLYEAQVFMLQGRYGDAKATLDRALRTATQYADSSSVGSAHLGLADVALSMGDYPEAADHLAQAVPRFEAQGDRDRANVARVWQAQLAASLGDFTEARRRTLEVLDWYTRAGNTEGQGVQFRALARYATRAGDWHAADEALRTAHELARQHDLRLLEQKLVYDEGQLARARGDLAGAERAFVAYLQTLPPNASVQRFEVQTRLAELHALGGQYGRAEDELRSAADALDHWRASLGDAELRVLAFQATSSEASDVTSSMTTALSLLARNGRAQAAFALAERRRARELADRLIQAEALTAGGDDAGRRARWQSYRAPAAEIASLIPDDSTALLEYVAGANGVPTTVFVLTRVGNEASAQTLLSARALPPLDSLAPAVGRFAALVESGADPRPLARALGAALLDSAIAELGPQVTRLVVVPDGVLHRLPFDALRLADGRYAVERFAVSAAPSASVVTELWRHREGDSRARGPARLLALGDPAFHETAETTGAPATRGPTSGAVYRSAFAANAGLPRLVASGDEARDVARYSPRSEVRLRGDASEAFLKHAALASFDVIHFATHALVDERSVAHTAIALAPGGGEDGFLTPGELAALPLRADLVVLSACRTAGGVVVAGEGVQGLTGPLLGAGARSVVATQWRIDDRAAVGLVDAFYQGLAAGLPAAEALRAAKLEALRRGAPASEWAAF